MIFALNWKMNGSVSDAISFVHDISDFCSKISSYGAKFVFCPPFTLLNIAVHESALCGGFISIGAQDCYHEKRGSRTGCISSYMLNDIGCSFSIVGHSESCAIRDQSRIFVREQADLLLESGICPIICIGEKDKLPVEKTKAFIRNTCLKDVPLKRKNDVIVAYEPIWAIGTGLSPSYEDTLVAIDEIKEVLGGGVKILYGGSVSIPLIPFIKRISSHVSGFLIGGASLNSSSCIELCSSILECN